LPALTPDERRGALLVALLLLIGAGWDAWRAASSPPPPRVVGISARPVRNARPAEAAPVAAVLDTAPLPRLDLNRAEARELDALPGIGPVLAGRIVEHRRLHGPFHSIDELRAVRGVGPRLLEKLRPRVRTSP